MKSLGLKAGLKVTLPNQKHLIAPIPPGRVVENSGRGLTYLFEKPLRAGAVAAIAGFSPYPCKAVHLGRQLLKIFAESRRYKKSKVRYVGLLYILFVLKELIRIPGFVFEKVLTYFKSGGLNFKH